MTGMYQFIIAGASGGYVSTANAGKGIIIIGNYYLYQGQTLEILIGQPGKSSYQNSSGSGSSGGGGTYISLNGNLLFVAGGGGGTGWTTTTENASTYANAVLTPYGNPGAPLTSATISPGSGGIGGNGGGGANSAGGGGGYYGSGLNTNPGLSYIAGGYGGIRISYITTGLLAYYDFASTVSYPGSGTVLNDLSGNGYNMTLINGAAFNATGAISESWTPTTYGTVPYTVGFASAFSVELLFSISDLNNNEWLFSYGTYATAGCISLVSSVSQLQIYVGNRGYPSGTAYTTGILAINNWYHLVITISTTVTAYYLNGVLQTLTSAPSFSGDFPLTAGANLILGNTPTLNSGPFAGSKIAMARIYNIALTQTQVQQNYAAALNKLSNNPYLLTPPNVGGFGGGGMSTLGAVGSSSSGGGGGGYSGGGSGGLATTVGGAGGGGGSYDISGYNNVATIYTGAIPYFYQISSISQNSILITATSAPYIITVSSTINLFIGQTVVTSGTTFGSIATATTYYIYSIINARTVTFATVNTLATQLTVTNATGTMVGTLTAFTTGTNVGYNLGPGFVYINMINTNTQSLANYQLQTLPKGILQNSLYRQILYPLDTLNQYSRASACGIYSLRLLSSCYTGPLVQLRRDTDNAIIDFYGNYDGILKTLNKQTVESWASGTIAYIVKWYDQSGYGNHANQYTITIQPILNYIIGQVDFKFSRYLNLPIGTVPSTNSEYSVILRHNTVGYGIPITTNAPGFLNSGTQTITTATGIANTMTSWTMTTTGLYSDNWAASLQSPSGWYSSNNSVSFVYNLANRYQYINGISSVTPLASTVHANTTANNAIGASGGGYLNGELYNICIFNTALLDSERNIIEKIPYGNTLTSYSTDPYYNDVNLLLHCDSINEYTSSTLNGNLVDSSIYKQKVVNLNISGNMRANSSYNNFIGGQSIYFDGTPTNYINITNGIGATYPNIFTAFGGIKTGPINISGTNYYIHTFLSTDTFTIINTALTIDLLIVAGGGGGGSTNDRTAGGGGAGGFLYYANSNYLPGSYGIVVGNGGAGGIGLGYNSTNGNNGGNSSFGGNLIAYGGGGGAGTNSSIAGTGGSGGGKTHNSGSTAGSNVLGQGYIGGAIAYDSGNGATGSFAASGGGGAGAIGGNGTSSGGGAGGIGVQNGITGSTVYYAGGGGGSIQNLGSAGPVGGAGGSGGGGAGATTLGPNQSTIAISGNNATYYGGGGGGAAANSAINGTILANTGGNGYQGIVILRYRA
jgi:hypothetical protein